MARATVDQKRLLHQIDLLLPELSRLPEIQVLSPAAALSVATVVPALQLLRSVVLLPDQESSSAATDSWRDVEAPVPSDEGCLAVATQLTITSHDQDGNGSRTLDDCHALWGSSRTSCKAFTPSEPQQVRFDAAQVLGVMFREEESIDAPRKQISGETSDSDDHHMSLQRALSNQNAPDVGTLRKTPFFDLDTVELRSNFSILTGNQLMGCKTCCIRPDGIFKLTWDACSMALILVLIVVIPIELGLLWDEESAFSGHLQFFKWINLFADVFFSIDIVLNFFTAFYDGTGSYRHLVRDRRRIIKTYVRGWFWIDLIATLPFAYVSDIFGGAGGSHKGLESMTILRTLKIAKAARALKVLRAMKLGGLMQAIEEQMVTAQSATVGFQLFKMSIIMILAAHVIACSWFSVGYWGEKLGYNMTWVIKHELENSSSFEQWVAAFYFAITTGTTVGYGDISATNPMERFIGSVMMLLTVMFVGQMIARIGQVVTSLSQREAEKMRAKREAMLFMMRKSVPKDLYQKILRYIEYVYDTDSLTSLSSVQFLEVLSQSLQEELRLEITGNFLRTFPLFTDGGEALVKAVCPAVRTLRAGKGDIVAQQGQANDSMFMIVQGEVRFMNQRGKMAGMLHGEDWFGARALFFEGLVHHVTLKCETDCEFLALSRPDFLHQIAQFPEVQQEFDAVVRTLQDKELRNKRSDLDPAAWF